MKRSAPALNRPRSAGFTLLELMITVAIAAILMGLGVPSFQSFIRDARATSHVNSLMSALHLARSEAVRRGAAVTLCPSTTVSSATPVCATSTTDWSSGFLLRDANDVPIRVWQPPSGLDTFTGPATLVYRGGGSLSAAATFTQQVKGCTQTQRREVQVNATGRAVVTRLACGS